MKWKFKEIDNRTTQNKCEIFRSMKNKISEKKKWNYCRNLNSHRLKILTTKTTFYRVAMKWYDVKLFSFGISSSVCLEENEAKPNSFRNVIFRRIDFRLAVEHKLSFVWFRLAHSISIFVVVFRFVELTLNWMTTETIPKSRVVCVCFAHVSRTDTWNSSSI